MTRIEAAEQCGFESIDGQDPPGQPGYFATADEIIAFAAVCERAGVAKAIAAINAQSAQYDRGHCCQENALAGECDSIVEKLQEMGAAIDAELAPLLEAERVRFLADHEAPILEGRHDDCAKPYDSRAAHVCVCHARMGNGFYFMPAGSCLEKSK